MLKKQLENQKKQEMLHQLAMGQDLDEENAMLDKQIANLEKKEKLKYL